MQDVVQFMDELFSYLVANSRPFYIYRPIPCTFDAKISELINVFMQAAHDERLRMINNMQGENSGFLFAFGERMAALAVREHSGQRLLEGLVALVLEDYKFDPRDNIVCLAPLYHSAVKIGVDPVSLFTKATSYAKNEAADAIAHFPSRPPELRSLESMGYKESYGPDGFRYEVI